MNIAICTPCSQEFWTIGSLTLPSKAMYGHRWGIEVHSPDYPDAAHDHGWGRIKFMQNYLRDVDWLWFMGADVMIVNQTVNCAKFLFPDGAEIVVAFDENGLQSDSMFLRNCPRVFDLLAEVLRRKETDFHLPWLAGSEQGCLVRTLAGLEAYENALPVEKLQAFEGVTVRQAPGELNRYLNDYRAGDMIFHACNMPTEERIRYLTLFNKQIIVIIQAKTE